jgi:ferredoxin
MEVQDALDDEDKSENVILLCQAKSTGNVTIEA